MYICIIRTFLFGYFRTFQFCPDKTKFSIDRLVKIKYTNRTLAEVAELADAHDSNSCSFGSVGSIPTFGTGTASCQEAVLFSPVRSPLQSIS